jgi:hypothetical protein
VTDEIFIDATSEFERQIPVPFSVYINIQPVA